MGLLDIFRMSLFVFVLALQHKHYIKLLFKYKDYFIMGRISVLEYMVAAFTEINCE